MLPVLATSLKRRLADDTTPLKDDGEAGMVIKALAAEASEVRTRARGPKTERSSGAASAGAGKRRNHQQYWWQLWVGGRSSGAAGL